MEEKTRQLNLSSVPVTVIAALDATKARIMEQTGDNVKKGNIGVRALKLWLSVDGLGLFDAIREARASEYTNDAIVANFVRQLPDKALAGLFRAVCDALER